MLLGSFGFIHPSLIDILDIVLVAAIIYFVLNWIKGSSAMNIFVAIIILLIIRILASALGMKMISSLLGTIIDVGAIALIVIFQPEIRRFLNNIGRSAGDTIERHSWLEKILPSKKNSVVSSKDVYEIAQACNEMSAEMTGALIVLRKNNPLDDIIATGDLIDARISSRLIRNIFFKNSPLHDGAMVVDGGRIIAARCTLPITDRRDIPASFGMRHKAAIGISETSDAEVIVVSEQTGHISYIKAGQVTRIESINNLILLIGEKTE